MLYLSAGVLPHLVVRQDVVDFDGVHALLAVVLLDGQLRVLRTSIT